MQYEGPAHFLDSDMIVLDDISKLFELKDETALQVVKDQKRFEWPSMMLFDCGQCKELTLDYVENSDPMSLSWATKIGNLPLEWNHCVSYVPKPETTPKLIHYTQGVPIWPEVRDCDYAEEWWDEYRAMTSTCSWLELMGNSVHAKPVMERLVNFDGVDY